MKTLLKTLKKKVNENSITDHNKKDLQHKTTIERHRFVKLLNSLNIESTSENIDEVFNDLLPAYNRQLEVYDNKYLKAIRYDGTVNTEEVAKAYADVKRWYINALCEIFKITESDAEKLLQQLVKR